MAPSHSHPVIRFEGSVPIVEGRLHRINEFRTELLDVVSKRTLEEFVDRSPELLIGEALYAEKFRLRRNRPNLFTRQRAKEDKRIWNAIQRGILASAAEVDRRHLLHQIVSHYSEEIGGRFNPNVYRFATKAVPWGFSWLLNAASVRRFLPWGMTESLESRIHIQGEIPHLKHLANRGTVLMVPTHQSNIDSLLIGYIIYLMGLPPFAYGAGLNLFSNPFFNFFMGNLGAYTVDRQKTNLIYKQTLKNYSTELLKQGVHSIFFPGGGRSRSGAIESKLKLGLLGTALEAQLENIQAGKPNPKVFVVPLVMSYHYVLEASSLIEDYLADSGKHRYIITDDESFQPKKVASFFWKFFSQKASVTANVGRPMDVFGNFVDENGESLGPSGQVIDTTRWLRSRGEIRAVAQRDHEYTRELGERIVERFHRENTVLTSHAAAFVFFELLRKRYRDLDLYRFLRLSQEQRRLDEQAYLAECERFHGKLVAWAEQGRLRLDEDLKTTDHARWVRDGVRQLGLLHEHAVVRIDDGTVLTEDMNLLYYYRNRLAGYGLGDIHGSGFLA